MTELTGVPLDVALAEALGWQKHVHWSGGSWSWHSGDKCLGSHSNISCRPAPEGAEESQLSHIQIPAWHASLDALVRDVWPVLRERGFVKEYQEDISEVWWVFDNSDVGFSPTGAATYDEPNPEALAFARACYGALKEGTE